MEDIKIRIHSESHSRKVQEALFKMGYKWGDSGQKVANEECKYMYALSNGWIFTGVGLYFFREYEAKEVVLSDLNKNKYDVREHKHGFFIDIDKIPDNKLELQERILGYRDTDCGAFPFCETKEDAIKLAEAFEKPQPIFEVGDEVVIKSKEECGGAYTHLCFNYGGLEGIVIRTMPNDDYIIDLEDGRSVHVVESEMTLKTAMELEAAQVFSPDAPKSWVTIEAGAEIMRKPRKKTPSMVEIVNL